MEDKELKKATRNVQMIWEKKSSRRLKSLHYYNYSSNVLIIRKKSSPALFSTKSKLRTF